MRDLFRCKATHRISQRSVLYSTMQSGSDRLAQSVASLKVNQEVAGPVTFLFVAILSKNTILNISNQSTSISTLPQIEKGYSEWYKKICN